MKTRNGTASAAATVTAVVTEEEKYDGWEGAGWFGLSGVGNTMVPLKITENVALKVLLAILGSWRQGPYDVDPDLSMLECLTACKASSHANAKGKGINSKGWVGNQVFR